VFTNRFDRVLAVVVVSGLAILGIGELIARLDEPMPLLFWLPTLWGGAVLILLGAFLVIGNARLSKTLVVVGCGAGLIPTMWTLVMPVLLLTLVIRTIAAAHPVAELPGQL